jgi:iron complex outermembrane receptor protein
MKKLLLVNVLFSLMFLSYGQSKITGRVNDITTNKALPFATIFISGTSIGTVTDVEGKFEIITKKPDLSLTINYLGYESKEVNVIDFNKKVLIELTPTSLPLKPVVVTSTKTKRTLDNIPGKVEYINKETIEKLPAQKIDDILSLNSGVNVVRPNGIYSMNPTVTLRGTSGDEQGRTLVLVDGVPQNRTDNGGVNWNRFNLNDIEAIEILKGPGSSLYGNNSMGGVINIITKKPSLGTQGQVGLNYGSFNTFRSDFSLMSRKENGFYYSLSHYYLKSDGYNDVPEDLKSNPDYSIPRFLNELAFSSKVGINKSKAFNAEIQFDIFNDKRGEGERMITTDGGYRHFNTEFVRGKVNGGVENWNYDANIFYLHENYADVNERMRGGSYSRYDVDADRVDYGATLNFNNTIGKNVITYGTDIRVGSIDGGDFYQTPNSKTGIYDTFMNRGQMSFIAFYVQDEINLFKDRLKVLAGLRYDMVDFSKGYFYTTDPWNDKMPKLNDNSWSNISPRLAISVKASKSMNIYLSYSQGFRASILDDLCRTGWMWVGPKYANPELGPEIMDNYELGFNLFPSEKMSVSAAAFYSKGKDFLYYVQTQDSVFGRPIYIRENITNVTIYGFESDFKYKISKNINLITNYTYNHSTIDEFAKNTALEGKALKYFPDHQFKFIFNWMNKYVNSNISLIYKSEQYTLDDNASTNSFGDNAIIDPYYTIDLKLWREIKDFQISLSVINLLDNQYLDNALYLSPGRIVNLGLRYKF